MRSGRCALWSFALATWACNSPGVPAVDATAVIDATVDQAGDCTNLMNDGPVVAERRVATLPPEMTGGSISPGLYRLTDAVRYTGPGGPSDGAGPLLRHSARFGVSTVELATQASQVEWWSSGTYAVAAGVLTVSVTCPDPSTAQYRYSADAGELRILVADAVVNTFTLQ